MTAKDQAAPLRELARSQRPADRQGPPLPGAVADQLTSLAVVSGKGGVGKSLLTLNLGLALSDLGLRVCGLDADLGMANLDTLLGITPRRGLPEVVRGEASLEDALVRVEEGFLLLPGCSGIAELTELSSSRYERLRTELGKLVRLSDYLLVDCSAGASPSTLRLASAADQLILVTTPEPTALVDAYSFLKILLSTRPTSRIHLVINLARSYEEGTSTYQRLSSVIGRHLGVSATLLGVVPRSRGVDRAVRTQRPLLRLAPSDPAAVAIRQMAARLSGKSLTRRGGFLSRLFG